MAILKIYSVKDSKVGVFGKPFCEVSDVQAIRALNIAVNDPNIQLSHFPEDFDLYHMGTFDDVSGEIAASQPIFVVAALSQKRVLEEIERISNDSQEKNQFIQRERKSNENVQPLRSSGK